MADVKPIIQPSTLRYASHRSIDAIRKKLAKFEKISILKIVRSIGYFQIQVKEYLLSDQNSLKEYRCSLRVFPKSVLMVLEA